MGAPEHFQRFARRMHAALLQVFHTLADSLTCIRLRRDVQQELVGFSVLHNRFRLSIKGAIESVKSNSDRRKP